MSEETTLQNAEPSSASPSSSELLPVESSSSLPPIDHTAAESTDAISSTIVSNIPPPPLQYGDLAALDLVHYTPAGFFAWLIEVTQVSTGLPFWSVIILTTLGARLAVIPFVIRGTRSAARLSPIQPQLAELRAKMNAAKLKGDNLAFTTAVQKQHSLMKVAGVNPFDTVLMSVAQLTVQFGFFIGLRSMCQAPVEQLKYGGFGFLTDLTISDPYYITPIICTALVNLQLTVSGPDIFCSAIFAHSFYTLFSSAHAT